MYILKMYEYEFKLYVVILPCLNDGLICATKEYERQKQEKAIREREQMRQALAHLKL